jgi:glycosyltransferase involved in cell wall biosynthesis
MTPFISICIPAFKRTDFLKRLLDSIAVQVFRDFEVIVSDDSPGDEVALLCEHYREIFPLIYHRNATPLGTPVNWNQAVSLAKGEWIKLMHDDDWFSEPFSLGEFANEAKENKSARFLFSAYTNVFEGTARKQPVFLTPFRKKKLLQDTVTLFSKNVIGPPSVTLVKADRNIQYDASMKWVVDIDFYIRYLQNTSPVYIDKLLVNVGIHKEQVTSYTFRVQSVEIPENFLLLEKTGESHLRNLLVYDAWWRIVRNMKIDSPETIRRHGFEGRVPPVILSMISWQRKIPQFVLRTGFLSKTFMFLHYLIYRKTIGR